MADTFYAEKKPEASKQQKAAEAAAAKIPPAGPHADPALTEETATPGSGALPRVEHDMQKDVDGGVG